MKVSARLRVWPLFVLWLAFVALGLYLENGALRNNDVPKFLNALNAYYVAGFVFSVWFCFLFVKVEVDVD